MFSSHDSWLDLSGAQRTQESDTLRMRIVSLAPTRRYGDKDVKQRVPSS